MKRIIIRDMLRGLSELRGLRGLSMLRRLRGKTPLFNLQPSTFNLIFILLFGLAAGCAAFRGVENPVDAKATKVESIACAGKVDGGKIGVCSWSWQLPMKGVAEQMAKANVKGIHLALGPFIAPDGRHGGAENADALVFVKQKIASGEWRLMSTMVGMVGEDYSTLETIKQTGGIVPDKHWQANQKIVSRGAQLTAELGCKFMSTHAGFLDESNPKALAKYVSRVKWMRDECRKYGVTLILESGQETAEDLAAFMVKVPGVGINFDPANMILYAKGKPMEAVRILQPWIMQVHIKDAKETKVPGTWGEEVPWGTGEVGGSAFIAELQKLGYNGNFVIEREGGSSRVKDISTAVQKLTCDIR